MEVSMQRETGMLFLLFIFGMVLVLVLFKSKVEFLINMVLRMMMGTIGICFVNSILVTFGVEFGIGINVFTLLTMGLLGFPGFVLLYGMGFYKIL